MSDFAIKTAELLNMLPESDQSFAYEFVKKLVLAWDPDFTKVTEMEAKRISEAEKSGFINSDDIDWENVGVNA